MPTWLVSLLEDILPDLVEGLIDLLDDWINSKTAALGTNPQIQQAQQALQWLQGYKARNDALKPVADKA